MNGFEQALPRYLSEDQLKKIRSVTVGLAGCGGLGSNCAFNLVRCGFAKFVLCDLDLVEASNLNRQFYFLDQLGMPKVEALKANLLRINPALSITTVPGRLDEGNLASVFAACDIVVEAFDTADCKRMIAEAFMRSGKLFVAASGLAGWGNSDDITVRRVHENFYLVGDGVSGVAENLPPLSPRVNIAAAKQADVVLSWVLNDRGQGSEVRGR